MLLRIDVQFFQRTRRGSSTEHLGGACAGGVRGRDAGENLMTGGQRGEKCAGKIVTAAGKIDRVDAQSVQMAARSFSIVIAAVAAQLDHDVFRAEPAEDLRRGGRVIFAGELGKK